MRRRRRIRSGLRRHGLLRGPAPIRAFTRSHALRFTNGNEVDLYEEGRTGLEAMLDAIAAARDRVHLETYIFRADRTGGRFLDALVDRARAGVEVRLLFDAFGSLGLPDASLNPLRESGADVVAFNPIGRWPFSGRFRRRDHRKILAVDGAVAFVGGLNIGDEYVHGLEAGDALWRDAHARVRGPVVRDLEAVFLESWFRADGPDLPWQRFLEQVPPRSGNVRCAVLTDGPVYRRRRARDLIVGALETATKTAMLESPYFAPGRRVLDALADASRRGIEIDLLLAGKTDHPVLRRAVRSIVPRLLRAGVRVHEYHAAVMHAKTAIFDGQWALLGTSNLDRQSFEHSYEVNLVVEGGEIPRRLRARFEKDVADAKRIDERWLAERGLLERVLDRLSALLLPWI